MHVKKLRMGQLVSVIIPTYNSALTIEKCLKSVKEQTYPNLELIVVDGYSNDATLTIVEKFEAQIIFRRHLLEARMEGFINSNGEYILLLDSDQVLAPTCVEKAVDMMRLGFDALILEEFSYKPKTVMQKLYDMDRRLSHETFDINPLHGVLLARFYKRWVLTQVFNAIPRELLHKVVVYDHAIINYEAFKVTQRIGFLRNVLYHIDPESPRQVVLKFCRYGKSAKCLANGNYRTLLTRKMIPRKGLLNPLKVHYSLPSLLLYFLKAIPFALGYLTGNDE
jgi:glycosyltransferase involved in cell wall biosynthesis